MTRKSRRHARIPFGASVELWKYRNPVHVRAGDLSAGGIFLRTTDDIAEGSFLTIRISLPGDRPFSALCRVVRAQNAGVSRRRGLALTFVDISLKDRARIESYVAQREFVPSASVA